MSNSKMKRGARLTGHDEDEAPRKKPIDLTKLIEKSSPLGLKGAMKGFKLASQAHTGQ